MEKDVVKPVTDYLRILSEVWGFPVFMAEGGVTVTIGLLFKGLLFLSLGYFLSQWLAKVFDNKILGRTKLDRPIRATLRKLFFYFLFLINSLAILNLIHFPIAIFTVVGGALAIGVGFGTQNIVNNFISGIILMLDRPIRVGDVVDVDGVSGVVEEIAARSSRIQRVDSTHIIVPNSKFLEQNVINWTLTDDVIRFSVKVGVAYGSDTALIRKILTGIALEHPLVLKTPQPIVAFQDFGESSLSFELFYWSKFGIGEQVLFVGSDLRFAIDNAFRQHRIAIPFPQMDVHLDSAQPIQQVLST